MSLPASRSQLGAIVAIAWSVCSAALGGPVPRVTPEQALASDEGLTADQQFQRALYYLNGPSGQAEFAKGMALLRRAAERGSPRAQSNLGVVYAEGRWVPADAALAVVWFRKAASGGWAEGQLNLGLACMSGQGIDRDPAEAVKWFLRAAQQGNAEAEFDLGLAYARGDGVIVNTTEARRWITLSAHHGYLPARDVLSTQDEIGKHAQGH